MDLTGTVRALWRYPVKSALGEQLDEVDVDADGVRGDRAWACLDGSSGAGQVASAKHPRRWGRLLAVRASLPSDDTAPLLSIHDSVVSDVDSVVSTRDGGWSISDGGWVTVRAGTAEADAVLSRYLGRAVHLSRTVPPGATLRRVLPDEVGLVPQWLAGAEPGQELVTAIAGARPGGRFLDFGSVHLVSTGALAALGRQVAGPDGEPVAAQRFRPNVVLDLGSDPAPGTVLRLGEVLLRVSVPAPRCAVPGLAQGDLPADRSVLATLARYHRVVVPGYGRAACFGVYAEVLVPGRLRRLT